MYAIDGNPLTCQSPQAAIGQLVEWANSEEPGTRLTLTRNGAPFITITVETDDRFSLQFEPDDPAF